MRMTKEDNEIFTAYQYLEPSATFLDAMNHYFKVLAKPETVSSVRDQFGYEESQIRISFYKDRVYLFHTTTGNY